jgi:hypothetical protein
MKNLSHFARVVSTDWLAPYEHELFNLEIELKQMMQENHISPTQYKKRILLLARQRTRLHSLSQKPPAHAPTLADMPALNRCLPEEMLVISDFCRFLNRFYQPFIQDTSIIARWTRKGITGRSFDFLVLFDLAKLKKLYMSLERRIDQHKLQASQWLQLTKATLG